MPSPAHEVLIVALREQPTLLRALVAKLTGAALPRGLRPVDATVRFVKTAEVRMDLVFQKRTEDWVVVELQRAIDPAKRRRWLLAASLLLDQTGVLGDLIVITARRAVGRWASRVAQLQTPLGTRLALTPVVLTLGMKEVEALLDQQHPELALFAAWAMHHRHGSKAREVVERAIELTERLPPSLLQPQMDAIISILSDPMLALLRKAVMNSDKFQERPAIRRLRLFLEEQGRLRGHEEGLREGLQEGLAEGLVKGKQGALVTLLETRGLSISSRQRATIMACSDPVVLDRWIGRAVTASSTSEVLGPAPKVTTPRDRRKRAATPRAATSRKSARAIKS